VLDVRQLHDLLIFVLLLVVVDASDPLVVTLRQAGCGIEQHHVGVDVANHGKLVIFVEEVSSH
jgi:hypothetical protein